MRRSSQAVKNGRPNSRGNIRTGSCGRRRLSSRHADMAVR